ncbi:hypothetical protein ANCDUO_07860 [Ancylostoma duodenale]|uniref:Uncharacterized protein n=1 Tax=Ancylostoma duodenale TaxID=51022 RepID=A0A0C2DHF0_9BILA|nr:hypothetical protein ANCDUO_07860 [Ancylostoma duodenale]
MAFSSRRASREGSAATQFSLSLNRFTFSTHCSLDDDDLSCWNSTLNFFSKVLIGQLRHYIAVQVDIDQWHRRHGKPNGQDMDEVSALVVQAVFFSSVSYRDSLLQMILNVCMVLVVIPFIVRLIRYQSVWNSETRLINS